ncbi:MAG: rod-binding protein [Aromatoleum sp.]|jgi:flagellar protein FlgJ|uniref:rod-binding protein n=1 Tax=Aromatoleum sp. TaxID=2307007 RepID=UPI00289476B7|nr:rod-binding protein [Aromatoleum sp.]MDT3671915.1 rod-binding protein [Aromatoleum sp.]
MNDTTIRGPLAVPPSNADPAIRVADEVADPAYRDKVEAAAQQFEGFFIAQMLRQMRSATRELAAEDSIFRNRINDDMLDLADTTVAGALAGQRAFGIADAIVRQLLPPVGPVKSDVVDSAPRFKSGTR